MKITNPAIYGTPALVLGTANAEGSATTAVRTDATLAAFDATAPVTQASADVAAVGVAAVAARRDHRHGMPTISASALTRAGGNTTEASTTSTVRVSISTSTVSIAVGTPILVWAALRKSAGAATNAEVGVTMNATEVDHSTSWCSSTDRAESGVLLGRYFYGQASYLRAGLLETNEGTTPTTSTTGALRADMPAVTLTSLIINGRVINALITMFVDEVHVYALAVA